MKFVAQARGVRSRWQSIVDRVVGVYNAAFFQPDRAEAPPQSSWGAKLLFFIPFFPLSSCLVLHL